MSMPEFHNVEFDPTATGVVAEVNVSQLSDKGYDFIRDVGAAFTAVLEGSVSGKNWTSVTTLAASGQGTVAAQYNFLRVKVSAAGALGATTVLLIGGKAL